MCLPVCVSVCVCAPDRTNKCFPIDMYGSGQNLDEIQSYAKTHNLPVRNPTLPYSTLCDYAVHCTLY